MYMMSYMMVVVHRVCRSVSCLRHSFLDIEVVWWHCMWCVRY